MTRPEPTILAFDTAAAHCAAALLYDDAVYGETLVPMKRGQAEALLPLLDATLSAKGQTYADLDAIAVGVGPGNFTGIRIAVSAARGLALSLGVPVVGVSTFEIMAFQHMGENVLVSLKAPRGQAYVQPFRRGEPVGDARMIDPEAPPRDLQMSFGMLVLGHRARQIAGVFEASYFETEIEDLPRRLCLIADAKLSGAAAIPAPTPLYIRPPDAAPSSDPPPVILP